jgi:hypothetical protein
VVLHDRVVETGVSLRRHVEDLRLNDVRYYQRRSPEPLPLAVPKGKYKEFLIC